MSLKFNKIILFIVVCMIAGMIIGCRNNNHISEEVETMEATYIEEDIEEETVQTEVIETIETTEATEPITEVTTEETEAEFEEEVEVENITIDNTYTEPEAVEPTEETEVTEPPEEVVEEIDGELIKLGNFKLTAYCACSKCCGKSDGITASGTIATQGRTVAVDPSVIPFGTTLVINGNTYIAEDSGGAIGGSRIDIFFNNHQDALNFGVQYADVYIKS